MRSVLILATIVALILLINGFIEGFIGRSADEMLAEIEAAVELMNAGDHQGLLKQVNAMQQRWERDESRWESCVNHEDIEQVNISLTRLNAMAEGGTLDIMPGEFQELAFLLEHIVEQHRFKLENIL